jgi:hypothetical protein
VTINFVLWKGPVVRETDEAEALLQPFYERDDDSGFEASADIALCADELRGRFPDDPSLDPPDEDSPWAEFPFHQTERLLFLTLRGTADDEVFDAIADLADKHLLVLYDPQGPELFVPDDLLEPEAPPGAADWVRFSLFALGSVAMLALGQRLRVPVLDGVLTAFGGFLTAVALFILVMFLAGRKRRR